MTPLTTYTDARTTETPNAVMTTLASPTQGGLSDHSLWRVEMREGQAGPLHSFDVDQAWHLLEGSATISLDEDRIELSAGDTVVLPAHSPRQISTEVGATFMVTGRAAGLATPLTADGPGEAVTPPWIA